MSDYRYPPPPPPSSSPQVGVFAQLWTLFRETPAWVQVVLWVLAWPFLAALLVVSTPPRPDWLRTFAAVVVLLLATLVWAAPFIGGDETAERGPILTDKPEPELRPEPAPSGDVWTVTRVVDGDTVDVQRASTTERARVIGIDTPERGECGFGPASRALAALVLNEQVVLTPGARDDRDRYDRILRYIDIGATDAGLSLIEQGLAIARYDSRDGYGQHPREDVYVAADNDTPHQCDGVTAPAPEPEPGPNRRHLVARGKALAGRG